jgi:Domain of unknown function (DUF5076)
MFGKKTDTLDIPPIAQRDRNALEVARVWIAEGGQHVSLRADAWKDPAAWGILLVDLAKHVANAHHELSGRDPAETLQRIRAGFDAEWNHATDEPRGGFLA